MRTVADAHSHGHGTGLRAPTGNRHGDEANYKRPCSCSNASAFLVPFIGITVTLVPLKEGAQEVQSAHSMSPNMSSSLPAGDSESMKDAIKEAF